MEVIPGKDGLIHVSNSPKAAPRRLKTSSKKATSSPPSASKPLKNAA